MCRLFPPQLILQQHMWELVLTATKCVICSVSKLINEALAAAAFNLAKRVLIQHSGCERWNRSRSHTPDKASTNCARLCAASLNSPPNTRFPLEILDDSMGQFYTRFSERASRWPWKSSTSNSVDNLHKQALQLSLYVSLSLKCYLVFHSHLLTLRELFL